MGRFGNLREKTIDDEYAVGWVPPGYDNLGPGNEVRIGPAGRSTGDVKARTHDIGYGDEEAAGVNPYVNWVDADEEFLNELQVEGPSTLVAKGLFSAKKAAKSIGLIGNMSGKQKAKRKSPWEEGEEYRAEREARKKRYEDNMRTRDSAWDAVGEHARQINLTNAMEGHDREDEEHKNSEWEEWRAAHDPAAGATAFSSINWDNFNPGDARAGWEMANNGGRNPVNSGGTPVGDIGIGGGRHSLPNSTSGGNMDVVDEGATAAARASSSGGSNPVSKETEVSTYPNLSYGLPETHTCILPWTGWLSVAKLKTSTPVQIRVRMNSPADMIDCATNDSTAALTQGVYNQPIKEDGTLATTTDSDGVSFPETFTSLSSTDTKERPAWRAYFGALYEYYTVLGCEYKITINNPVSNIGASVMVGTQFDSYSDTAGQTGNVMPQAALSQVMAYKHLKWDIIQYSRSEVANRNNAVISGRYTPGMVKRNIQNDGDVKTWTSTGAKDLQGTNTDSWATPVLKDFLTLNFYKAPLGFHATTGCNIQFELKYIVQFKDLRQQARYPNTLTTDQDIVQTLNESTTAVGNAYQRWR